MTWCQLITKCIQYTAVCRDVRLFECGQKDHHIDCQPYESSVELLLLVCKVHCNEYSMHMLEVVMCVQEAGEKAEAELNKAGDELKAKAEDKKPGQ